MYKSDYEISRDIQYLMDCTKMRGFFEINLYNNLFWFGREEWSDETIKINGYCFNYIQLDSLYDGIKRLIIEGINLPEIKDDKVYVDPNN